MLYIFDIDGTIADTMGDNYEEAIPDEAMITLVNMLYDREHTIVFITARGTSSGIDYTELTEKQLKDWGVNYDALQFGKIITDWAQNPEGFLNEI